MNPSALGENLLAATTSAILWLEILIALCELKPEHPSSFCPTLAKTLPLIRWLWSIPRFNQKRKFCFFSFCGRFKSRKSLLRYRDTHLYIGTYIYSYIHSLGACVGNPCCMFHGYNCGWPHNLLWKSFCGCVLHKITIGIFPLLVPSIFHLVCGEQRQLKIIMVHKLIR